MNDPMEELEYEEGVHDAVKEDGGDGVEEDDDDEMDDQE